jgi:hypothetical protein
MTRVNEQINALANGRHRPVSNTRVILAGLTDHPVTLA